MSANRIGTRSRIGHGASKSPRSSPERGLKRPRVRRGNVEDANQLKAALTQAALEVFNEAGLDAVSIRAVAERVGVSLMTPYRYFENKSALLASLWEHVLHSLHAAMKAASDGAAGGRARVEATTAAFMTFWQSHPDEFRLVHQTQHAAHATERPGAEQAPIYAELLALVRRNTEAFANELGTGLTHAKLAEDVSFAMQQGYLNAALVNRRYPWGEMQPLRATFVRQIVAAVEQCLREGPAEPPCARSTKPVRRV